MQLLDFEHDSAGNLIGVTVEYDGERISFERIKNAEWIPWQYESGKVTKHFLQCTNCAKHPWPRSEIHMFARCPQCGAFMKREKENVEATPI